MEDSAAAYKLRHEQFVTGLSGGPIWEIYWVSLTAPLGVLTWGVLHHLYFKKVTWLPALMADFVLNWLALLLSITIYASNVSLLHLLLGLPLIIGGIGRLFGFGSSTKKFHKKPITASNSALPHRSFLTVYRANMMIITCTAILAVDFKVFPRRFAKAETWGTSLMDMGVGAFVFSMGLVSSRAILVNSVARKKLSLKSSLRGSLRHAGPVLFLGLMRLLLVKVLGYHEHVSEYGEHWNFFMTLGFLPPVVALLGALPDRLIPQWALALIIGAVYEYALSYDSLRAYLLTAPRVDLISKNREGIFSFIGYLSIFLIGRSTGYYTLPATSSFKNMFYPPWGDSNETKKASKDNRLHIIVMLFIAAIFYSGLLQFSLGFLTPSRRLANLPYILFVVSFNILFLALFQVADYILFIVAGGNSTNSSHSLVPYSLQAVNYNGLYLFLLANIVTGIINMSLHTIDLSTGVSLAILTIYLLALFVTSILLYNNKIRLRFI